MSAEATAVVVTRRSRETVDCTLEALRPGHEAGQLACIVVDNSSDDGTIERIQDRHPWVTLLASRSNLGFARSCNVGLARARTRHVAFLAPQIAIAADGICALGRFLDEHPAAGLAAPAVKHAEGTCRSLQPLPTPLGVLAREGGLDFAVSAHVPVWPGAEPFRSDRLDGGVLMARKRLLEDLEGLDPRFFRDFASTDLCVRASAAGAELWMVPGVLAEHVPGPSRAASGSRVDSSPHQYFADRHHYLCKHFGVVAAVSAVLGELALMSAGACSDLMRGRRPERLLRRVQAPILRAPRSGTRAPRGPGLRAGAVGPRRRGS